MGRGGGVRRVGGGCPGPGSFVVGDEEGDARDDAAGVLDELAHGAGGAAGGEEVVHDEDAVAAGDGVDVDFEGVGAVFELVGGGYGFPGELVGLAGENEALAGAVGEGSAEDEAAGFG